MSCAFTEGQSVMHPVEQQPILTVGKLLETVRTPDELRAGLQAAIDEVNRTAAETQKALEAAQAAARNLDIWKAAFDRVMAGAVFLNAMEDL